MGFSRQEYWSGLPFPSPVDHILSDLSIYWKDWCWSWNSNTLVTWCEEPTHWKRLWCWERLKAGGERDYRGWDGWMASPTRWTWVWANSESWWWTGKPGVLQSWLSDWTGLNWTNPITTCFLLLTGFLCFPIGLPSWLSVRVHLPCRRHYFDPWIGEIPWKRKLQPTPVFLPGHAFSLHFNKIKTTHYGLWDYSWSGPCLPQCYFLPVFP